MTERAELPTIEPRTRFAWKHQYDQAEELRAEEETKIIFEDESLTNQHFAKDADINHILKRMGVVDGGTLPAELGVLDPFYYGDFTNAVDATLAMQNTIIMKDKFMMLPADIRDRFNNDPVKLFAFVTNPKNVDEAVKLGLLARKPDPIVQDPLRVIVTKDETQTPTK